MKYARDNLESLSSRVSTHTSSLQLYDCLECFKQFYSGLCKTQFYFNYYFFPLDTLNDKAARAGKLLKLHGYEFDEAHASVLKRAVRTLWTALHSSNQHWIPVQTSWRLNERHYGALTGLSKKEAGEQLGEEMLLQYRRG